MDGGSGPGHGPEQTRLRIGRLNVRRRTWKRENVDVRRLARPVRSGPRTHCPGAVIADIFTSSCTKRSSYVLEFMAHITYVPYEDAAGLLEELYARYRGPDGQLDNIVRIHSLNPLSMQHHLQLYAHLMRGQSPLTRVQREMIAVTVSAANDCFY